MTRFAEVARRSARSFLLFVVGTAAFAAAYCQAPLYYSNQNQYFLHGLAAAGPEYGYLHEDWLAGTRDPTPLFSALVAFTARHLHPWGFHVYQALLLGIYGVAMLGLFDAVAGRETARRRWPLFLALFVAAHAALPRWCSYRWLGADYPWFLQAGLAGQYVLGPMFQPSVFGVLLVVAVALFARGRTYPAAFCAALAAVLHFTYLLSAGMIVLGMIAALLAERRPYHALGAGALALALALPVAAGVLLYFGPTSPVTSAEANAILVNFRIPHHARPDLWLDAVAVAQVAWVVLAAVLARPARLRYLLAVPALLALLLTLAQVATHSDTLALLFPWRVSSVLVPVATTVVLSRLAAALPPFADTPPARVVSAAAVAVCVAGGVWISVRGVGFRSSDEELPLLNYAREHRGDGGKLYFLPVHVPDLAATTHGSLSSDFKPLADKQRDGRVIPVDLQRFRLYTGVAIFVDFKSIPYKDTEVLQWHARLRLAREWQDRIQAGELHAVLAEMRLLRITHLVVSAGSDVADDGLEKVYGEGPYWVYRLGPGPDHEPARLRRGAEKR
jgi:hypothetical protein